MAYCLTIKNGNDYKLLDISMLDRFNRMSRFRNSNSYSLEEIDLFTSSFDNEISFREYLYNNGVITSDEITKDISIRMKKDGKLVKVDYGLVYSDNKKYLDIYYLRSSILKRACDYEFLNKLLARYRNSYSNNENIALIRNIMLGNNNLSMYKVLEEFIICEIYNKKYNKKINDYEYCIKYKSLHDLAMFVDNYENKSNEIDRKNSLINLRDRLCPKPKVRRKTKNNDIEGQIYIFDLL